jgi:hypothetical protein
MVDGGGGNTSEGNEEEVRGTLNPQAGQQLLKRSQMHARHGTHHRQEERRMVLVQLEEMPAQLLAPLVLRLLRVKGPDVLLEIETVGSLGSALLLRRPRI